MKKIITIVLVVVMLFSLSACGKKTDFTDNETLNYSLTSMSDEFKTTSENFYSKAETIAKNMGDTYNGYTDYINEVYTLYDEILTKSEDIYLRTQNDSIEYYEMVASYVALNDECWEEYMRAFEDVLDSSMTSYYDVCYDSLNYIHNECIELLKSEFYSDKIDADTYFKETENLNNLFTKTSSKLHDLHLERYDTILDDFYDVYSGFSAGNTNVDENLGNELYYNETATADEVN